MTLVEIMITLVIISILGTFAATTYVRAYEKNRGYQAVTALRVMRAAEKLYYLDWNSYTCMGYTAPSSCTSAGCPSSPLITGGYFQCPNAAPARERGFNYGVVPGGNSYVASATREGVGRYVGRIISITVTYLAGSPETITWGGTWPAEWIPSN